MSLVIKPKEEIEKSMDWGVMQGYMFAMKETFELAHCNSNDEETGCTKEKCKTCEHNVINYSDLRNAFSDFSVAFLKTLKGDSEGEK